MHSSHMSSRRRPDGVASRGAGHRPPARERRATFLSLAFCLTFATGIALLGAGVALTDARVAATTTGSSEVNAHVVGDFYSAINDAIRTGDAGALDVLVSPDVEWCRACPGQTQTLAGLTRYLVELHRTAPPARLAVETVVSDAQGTVMAQVTVSGFPVAGDQVPWGPVDTLHLDGGWITERQNGPDGITLVEPLFNAGHSGLPPAVKGRAMARLTFPTGSGIDELLSAGPTWLVVEAGSVAVQIANGGRILRADGDDEMVAFGAGLAAVLQQGDTAIVPAGVRHNVFQQGTEPAVVLGVTLFFVDDGSDPRSRPRPDLAVFGPVDQIGREIPQPRPLPDVRFLAGGTVKAWPTGPVNVTLGRAVLGPGGHINPAADEEVLLAVETGTLEVNGGEERTVVAGTGVVNPAGPDREFRNVGDGLMVLLILTVAAEPA
jgi:quercetin dioxygenase-like cupin family protein/ketosteroid isomerase-like protein